MTLWNAPDSCRLHSCSAVTLCRLHASLVGSACRVLLTENPVLLGLPRGSLQQETPLQQQYAGRVRACRLIVPCLPLLMVVCGTVQVLHEPQRRVPVSAWPMTSVRWWKVQFLPLSLLYMPIRACTADGKATAET